MENMAKKQLGVDKIDWTKVNLGLGNGGYVVLFNNGDKVVKVSVGKSVWTKVSGLKDKARRVRGAARGNAGGRVPAPDAGGRAGGRAPAAGGREPSRVSSDPDATLPQVTDPGARVGSSGSVKKGVHSGRFDQMLADSKFMETGHVNGHFIVTPHPQRPGAHILTVTTGEYAGRYTISTRQKGRFFENIGNIAHRRQMNITVNDDLFIRQIHLGLGDDQCRLVRIKPRDGSAVYYILKGKIKNGIGKDAIVNYRLTEAQAQRFMQNSRRLGLKPYIQKGGQPVAGGRTNPPVPEVSDQRFINECIRPGNKYEFVPIEGARGVSHFELRVQFRRGFDGAYRKTYRLSPDQARTFHANVSSAKYAKMGKPIPRPAQPAAGGRAPQPGAGPSTGGRVPQPGAGPVAGGGRAPAPNADGFAVPRYSGEFMSSNPSGKMSTGGLFRHPRFKGEINHSKVRYDYFDNGSGSTTLIIHDGMFRGEYKLDSQQFNDFVRITTAH
jgi:hypothetical protein